MMKRQIWESWRHLREPGGNGLPSWGGDASSKVSFFILIKTFLFENISVFCYILIFDNFTFSVLNAWQKW